MHGEAAGSRGGCQPSFWDSIWGKGSVEMKLVLWGSCGCHVCSAVGFCNDWSVPSVRISCVLSDAAGSSCATFGAASLTSVELLGCDVWLYFYFSNLFLQGQCCVSQRRGWHWQNQSLWLTAIQLFKGPVRCHRKMCCSTLHPGLSHLGFYLPCIYSLYSAMLTLINENEFGRVLPLQRTAHVQYLD